MVLDDDFDMTVDLCVRVFAQENEHMWLMNDDVECHTNWMDDCHIILILRTQSILEKRDE